MSNHRQVMCGICGTINPGLVCDGCARAARTKTATDLARALDVLRELVEATYDARLNSLSMRASTTIEAARALLAEVGR